MNKSMNFNIAILMCIYKGDSLDYLKESLESVTLKQENIDLDKVRVYLHVDGDINEEIRNYIDDNSLIYKVLKSEVNVGLAIGLNKLLDVLCDEKYIFRMDADDVSVSDRLFKQISYMEKNPSIDASGGSISEFIGEKTNVVSLRNYPLNKVDIYKKILKASPFAHVTMCYTSRLINKGVRYPTQYSLNEDIALWFELLKMDTQVGNINDVLVFVRMDGAYSRRTYRKALSEFKVYREISTWKKEISVYHYLRFIFRLFPSSIVKFIYNSKLRKKITN